MATIKQLLTDGEEVLHDSDSPRLDAEILLACVMQRTRTWLYTWPEHIPSLPEQHLYLEFLRQRQSGTPVAYLTHRKEFWNLELEINDAVLIPRPETEVLVETALSRITGSTGQVKVADLGTGSGAIALALASEKHAWQIVATDTSKDALALAKKNAARLQIDNVEFIEGDWCDGLEEGAFDAILSNPPYIDEQDPHLQRGDVRFEPRHALISADHGLADIKSITGRAPKVLKPRGWLMLEHGYGQGETVRKLFSGAGFTEIETVRDLSGNERVTIGRQNA